MYNNTTGRKMSELEITTMSEKGQIVIPQDLRKKMGLKPKAKFAVERKGDAIVLIRLSSPDVQKKLDEVFRMMDKKRLKITDIKIAKEIKEHRKKKKQVKSKK